MFSKTKYLKTTYRKLLDEVPTLIWKSGPDSKFNYFNERWLNFTGRSMEQELGDGWVEGIYPCDLQRWTKTYNEAFCSKEPFNIEFRIKHCDGTYHCIVSTGQPFFDLQGNFTGYIGSCHDINESKQSEKMLELYYRSLIENSSDCITVLDSRRIIKYVSPSVERVLGYRPDDLVGRYAFDLVHPEDNLKVTSNFSKSISNPNTDVYNEFRLLHKNGSWRVIRTVGKNLLNNPAINGIVANLLDVTEQKKIEQERRKNEQKFQFLFHNAYDGIVLTKVGDTPGEAQFLEVNNTACERYGYTRKEFLSLKLKDVITEESLNRLKRGRREFIRNGSATNEIDYQAKNGALIPHEVTSTLLDRNSNPVIISISRDISERKKAEEALRDARNKLNAVIQASPLAIIVIDPLGKVVSWNSAAESTFGWIEEEIIGQPYPLVPDEFKEEHEAMLQRTLYGATLVGVEVRRKTKDGRVIDVSICTACLYDSKDSINGLMITIEDISERKSAREALLEAQFQQKAILDNIPDLVWLKDQKSRFIIVNEAFASSCGVSVNDLVGKNDFDIWNHDLARKYRDDDLKVIQSKRRHYSVEPLVDSMGNKKWLETIKTPIFNDDGEVIGTTGVARDVTERKRSEIEILESRQKAEKAMRMASIGAMAAGIAHEINQPLNCIKVITDGALFWQKKGKEISIDKAIANFRKISAEVERITEIITNMRSVIQKNRDSKVSLFNLNDALIDAINLIESQLKFHNVVIKKTLTEPLPLLMGRKSLFEEVVINLLINAIQAFEGTENDAREILCITKFEEKLILEISDNATGIKEEYLDKVLDPFFSTKSGKGMGLGLFIAHTIVTNLGGKIEIKENDRGGATFILEFQHLNRQLIQGGGLLTNEYNGYR